MTWDTSVFWGAFKAAGMLVEATFQPSAGPAITFDAGFTRPDTIVLDGVVHSTDYSIEYQSGDVQLVRDNVIAIDAVQYRIRQSPTAKGDGTFMVALLEKVQP
jgi:hypothetical protein